MHDHRATPPRTEPAEPSLTTGESALLLGALFTLGATLVSILTL